MNKEQKEQIKKDIEQVIKTQKYPLYTIKTIMHCFDTMQSIGFTYTINYECADFFKRYDFIKVKSRTYDYFIDTRKGQ